MVSRVIAVSILALSFAPLSHAREALRVVEGNYRYVVPENVAIAQAEAHAVECAMIDALANEFGTYIESEILFELHQSDSKSSSDFLRLSSSLVKGEWIETIGTPDIQRFLHTDGSMVIEAHVKGKALPIQSTVIDLITKPKCVSSDGVFESQRFQSGDLLELEFATPVDGYLSVFLADEDGNVFPILPYPSQSESAIFMKGGTRQTFFHDNKSAESEKYRLYTNRAAEHNILFILFSPSEYVKPYSEPYEGMRRLRADDFRKWLSRLRTTDRTLQLRTIPLTIISK